MRPAPATATKLAPCSPRASTCSRRHRERRVGMHEIDVGRLGQAGQQRMLAPPPPGGSSRCAAAAPRPAGPRPRRPGGRARRYGRIRCFRGKAAGSPRRCRAASAPRSIASFKASSSGPRSCSRGGRNAPTPGSTRHDEAAISAGSAESVAVAPRCRSARNKLPRLPTPESITVTRIPLTGSAGVPPASSSGIRAGGTPALPVGAG